MSTFTLKNRILLLLVVLLGFTTACKKKDKDEETPAPAATSFRTTKIDYSTLTATTSYKTAFKNEAGDTTVNRDLGRNRLRMFRALIAYVGSSISGNVDLDSATMSNMFANKNNPFTGVYADLNNLDISIKEVTASSKADQADIHDYLEYAFGQMARISKERANAATKGFAGKHSTGNYLVDEAGIEWAQIIQKTLIGAYHLDYIGNVLLNTGLNADNTKLVTGKKYTQLEQNWDEAYGFFSNNDIYYDGATAESAPKIDNSKAEYYLGAYAWEYNRKNFGKLHSAFLKGRAAIHNNDMTEVKAQAKIIREVLEYAIGAAAHGYMGKSVGAPHSFGEGFGFINATSFCTLTGADDEFAADLIEDLFPENTPTTFYDITVTEYTTVRNKLVTKFNIQ
ncbi:DUF4856 domain-containing protein [Cytophaga hutchinsonii]|jgi:hypothetical protein|uniref:DUF4856 domain-containing protein n=1 Tax=Cytophaga hutchinsonii (strain ATCC 33406 / DSM 1761 / CIP 103989 / NBRC 15051 / NCIMB 9469 / D465) TaxID=269798 RepID=A0A6N4SMU9_CYTH3|nr:DUF4856 domain-containing protein [Cytophaga hutchinsonii]ABG57600.1 hypothetical protein CHU_0309 [Cytophaga hutchinsonii ATCC 33406]SFX00836.1 protein of unknown function [Cytophaga hutchinsonii ATCC 33406]